MQGGNKMSTTKQTKGKTVIIVAQRISTILNADQIIVLDEGKIVGKGRHKELMQNCEEYKEDKERCEHDIHRESFFKTLLL